MSLLETALPLPRAAHALALACFFVSGACGLAYEIVWVRQLTLVAGATTPAVSTVLAVFMGGLALGAHLFGRWADRSPNLLRLYAWLELGIGLCGLLQPWLLGEAGSIYIALARQGALTGMALIAARLTAAAAVLLLPCVLMGGTLPVLARFVGRSQERFGLDLGMLYAINLAGAVSGSLLTGFVLVRELGLGGTIAAAVLGNLLVGLAALLASNRRGDDRPDAERSLTGPPGEALPARLRVVLWGLAGLSGFVTMGYQVTWTRMLSFGFDSTVYAFTVILVTFLLGLALGSLAFARLDRRAPRLRLLLAAHVLGGLTALLLTPLAARQPAMAAAVSARFGFTGEAQLASMALGAAVVMLLPTSLMGIVFPLAGRLLVDELGHVGRQLGRAYWINTLGAILGSLSAGFLLIPACSLKGSLLALAVAQAGAGLLLLPWCGLGRRSRIGLALACGLALLAASAGFEALLPGASPFDTGGFATQRLPARLLAHRDDVTASASVIELTSGARALRINGFEAATDDAQAGYMPMMSHLPMLLHPRPRRVLVICFGTGSTAGAALAHPGARVDVVDINASVLAFAPWFERTNRGVFRDPRARLILDDGRNHLLTTGESYDIVTSEPMPPTHAGVVNLYSHEYYVLARQRLAPGGLLVQWLPFHLVESREASDILRTVRSVFPETTLWLHSLTGLIVARAEGPVRIDWLRLQQAWSQPSLAAELARLGLPRPEALTQLYMAGSDGVGLLAEGGRVVRDDRPTLEFHPLRHKLQGWIGSYTDDSARTLAGVFAVRSRERLPLDGAAPEQARQLQEAFDLRSVVLAGDLQMALGQPQEARRLYEAGLRLGPGARPLLLVGMALAERAAGHAPEARRLAQESLALQPDNQRALALLRELEGGA